MIGCEQSPLVPYSQLEQANFPFLPNEDNSAGQGSHENYIINNGFWRNVLFSILLCERVSLLVCFLAVFIEFLFAEV